jgi:hypothetical protein
MDQYFCNSSSLDYLVPRLRGRDHSTFKIPKSAQLSSSRVKCSCSTRTLFLLEKTNTQSDQVGRASLRRLLPRRFQMSMTMRRAAALGARHILASSAANSRVIARRHVRPLSPNPTRLRSFIIPLALPPARGGSLAVLLFSVRRLFYFRFRVGA